MIFFSSGPLSVVERGSTAYSEETDVSVNGKSKSICCTFLTLFQLINSMNFMMYLFSSPLILIFFIRIFLFSLILFHYYLYFIVINLFFSFKTALFLRLRLNRIGSFRHPEQAVTALLREP